MMAFTGMNFGKAMALPPEPYLLRTFGAPPSKATTIRAVSLISTASSISPATNARQESSCGRATGPKPERCSSEISRPGPRSSDPEFIKVGSRLIALVTTEEFGREIWVADLAPPLPGDYDRNGLIQPADHTFWAANFGATTGLGLQADGNNNGMVDAADYNIWRDNFIPPATVSLLAPSQPRSSARALSVRSRPLARDFAPPPPKSARPIAASPPRRSGLLLAARDAAFAELGAEENPSPFATHKPARKIAAAKTTVNTKL